MSRPADEQPSVSPARPADSAGGVPVAAEDARSSEDEVRSSEDGARSLEGEARPFGEAVVVGAGVAGLLAARALSDSFRRVTLVERDRLGTGRAPRSGVPQAHHIHALTTRGGALIEAMFPGFRQELSEAGAPVFDAGADARALFADGWAPRSGTMGVRLQAFTRPFLEFHLRRRVVALPGVRLRDGCRVVGLDTARGRVTGVIAHDRSTDPGVRDADAGTDTGVRDADVGTGTGVRDADVGTGTGTGVRNTGTGAAGRNAGTFVLKADLVVVAAGRSSHLPTWLADLGLPHPHETVLDAPVGYASRLYDNPGGRWPDWVLMVEFLQAPSVRRGCFATRVEEGRFFVTLQGVGDDRPPHGDEGFAEFAGSLRAPLADVLAPLRPRTSPRTYALTGNRRLAYHRLRRWPDGLVALGDAVCVFNPVYGQGMGVAALEAALLREVLAPHARRAAALPGASPSPYASLPPGVTRRFQRRLARLTLEPWLLSTSTDWGWQQRAPSLPHRMALWYLRGVLRASTTEPEVYTRFVRVLNMLSRPTALLHPRVVTKVLAGGLPTRARTRVRPRARTRRRARSGTARGAGGGAEQVGPGP